jgi:peptidoglycan/xylan/chitin deacetylase (PgdA/CDA1 family)
MSEPDCTRRDFLRSFGLGATSLVLPWSMSSCGLNNRKKTNLHARSDREKVHLITLSFDDGFARSSIRTAEIYEKYGLSACINVIASGHLNAFRPPGQYIRDSTKGDFGLWNELSRRGHEIMPHGYKHANLSQLPLAEAQDLVLRCLDYFSRELKDFEAKEAVFNFPYNSSTPQLEQWLSTQVMAFRTGGGAINPLPHKGQVKLTCTSHGPGSCEQDLEQKIAELLRRDSGWLVYNTHGLDGEGWGPLRSSFLDRLLERLTALESVSIMPAGRALTKFRPA